MVSPNASEQSSRLYRVSRSWIVVGLIPLLCGVYLVLKRSPIDAVAWEPAASPGLVGPFEANDALAEQMQEFGDCIRNDTEPEVGGEWASRSLAVIRAGVKSAREGRLVTIEEIMESGE